MASQAFFVAFCSDLNLNPIAASYASVALGCMTEDRQVNYCEGSSLYQCTARDSRCLRTAFR
eukprot:scaffold2051_cov389-Prasinococcus_capsulatus_cf.AAC.17